MPNHTDRVPGGHAEAVPRVIGVMGCAVLCVVRRGARWRVIEQVGGVEEHQAMGKKPPQHGNAWSKTIACPGWFEVRCMFVALVLHEFYYSD